MLNISKNVPIITNKTVIWPGVRLVLSSTICPNAQTNPQKINAFKYIIISPPNLLHGLWQEWLVFD